jgi:hypothetical protein
MLGTIYSTTTILVGDANIGILQRSRPHGSSKPRHPVAVALIGPYPARRVMLSGQDFFAKPLDELSGARC